MGRITIRGISGLALVTVCLMVGCATTASDVVPDDDSGTTPDGSRADARSGSDSGNNKDSSTTDSGGTDSSSDDASIDDGSADADDGSDASGPPDSGAICPVCTKLQACCMIKKSFNYGKCYSKLCLACCM